MLASKVYGLLLLGLYMTASNLWSQQSRDFILAARRTNVAEIIDPTTLETVARIHFDFDVERLSAGTSGSEVEVEGLGADHGCCAEYTLDLTTMKMSRTAANTKGYYGAALSSPDGRWQAQLKSFRGASLRMRDAGTGRTRELTPTELPLDEESCGGNWAAEGEWAGEQFYFYVECPNHPGFLWTVTPGEKELGVGVAVGAFGEIPECRWRWPVYKTLVGAGDRLFLFEPVGGKSERLCESSSPGGVWTVDTASGRLRQIAPGLHFSALFADRSGAQFYGVALSKQGWNGTVELVQMDARDGTVLKSRAFDAGVLQIAAGQLTTVPLGDAVATTGLAQ